MTRRKKKEKNSILLTLEIPLQHFTPVKAAVITHFETLYIRTVLERTGYNFSHTAELAGLGRGHLKEIMQRLGIERPAHIERAGRGPSKPVKAEEAA